MTRGTEGAAASGTTGGPATAGSDRGQVLLGSNGRRWRLRATPDLSGFDDAGPGLPLLVRVLLAHRGVRDTEGARRYLGTPRALTDPRLMPQLDVAVERLAHACRHGETVAVFGDYDVDGITATTVLVEGLTCLGARPIHYIPDRVTEGYGPSVRAVRQLADRGASLLVTADCGTSAVTEVDAANETGMDVVVIDHHTVPERLPRALAIVNPKLTGSEYGSEPAAVGVAYKVVEELHAALGREHGERDDGDGHAAAPGAGCDPAEHRALVALGTVCDVAPLVGENRDLVRLGLDALRGTRRPGLRALADAARIDLARATPDTIGWVLGPRLNAAGRMEHARLALDLLLTGDEGRARELAGYLEGLNQRRRHETEAAMAEARDTLSPAEREAPLVFFASPNVGSGIVGLTASRLAEECWRPVVAVQVTEDELRASCRSIPEFDITAHLRRHGDLFIRYGGHRAAAGFSADPARLDEIRETLVAGAAAHLDTAALGPALDIDTELPLGAVDGRVLRWLELLGPHGEGNPPATFLARGVRVEDSRAVGRGGEHLAFRVRAGSVTWRAISFRNAEWRVPDGEAADIVYRLRRDDFAMQGGVQLEVLDLRRAE